MGQTGVALRKTKKKGRCSRQRRASDDPARLPRLQLLHPRPRLFPAAPLLRPDRTLQLPHLLHPPQPPDQPLLLRLLHRLEEAASPSNRASSTSSRSTSLRARWQIGCGDSARS